jgi:hypothetical protein
VLQSNCKEIISCNVIFGKHSFLGLSTKHKKVEVPQAKFSDLWSHDNDSDKSDDANSPDSPPSTHCPLPAPPAADDNSSDEDDNHPNHDIRTTPTLKSESTDKTKAPKKTKDVWFMPKENLSPVPEAKHAPAV